MSASSMELERATTKARAHHAGGASLPRFIGHFVEMTVAMMIGMGIGGELGISQAATPELKAVLWFVAMTVPMVGWMRFRGMSWRQAAEMSAAMAIPTLVMFPALWGGLITPRVLNSVEHGTMAPAMLAAMLLRRKEYGL